MVAISRRGVLGGLVGVGVFAVAGETIARQVYKEVHELLPGEYVWYPERSPEGPVAVVVSIPDQLVHVYRNGVRIAVSTCSTGKPGHETPTGVFTILQKDANHHSSTYNNAPMPNMNRLTWSGIALHAGKLPGYPASHGCVRLPLDLSDKLFHITHLGTPVIISGSHADPLEVVHPGMVLGAFSTDEFDEVISHLDGKEIPTDWNTANPKVTSVVISAADREITIFENGEILADGVIEIADPENPLGYHVFVLEGAHAEHQGLSWHAIGHHENDGAGLAESGDHILRRLKAGPDVVATLRQRLHPGLVMITTDAPAHSGTRTGEDFVIINTEDA